MIVAAVQGLRSFLPKIWRPCAQRLARFTQVALVAATISAAFSPHAFAITRIGNSKFGSDDLGFEATLSRPFVFARELDGDGALLVSQGDTLFRDGETLTIRPLEQLLPQTIGISRAGFLKLFSGDARKRAQWERVVTRPGVEAFVGVVNGRQYGVAAWGPDRGVVLSASIHPVIRESIRQMLASIEAREGDCPWE